MLEIQRMLQSILSPRQAPANGSQGRQTSPEGTAFGAELAQADERPVEATSNRPVPLGPSASDNGSDTLQATFFAAEAARRMREGETGLVTKHPIDLAGPLPTQPIDRPALIPEGGWPRDDDGVVNTDPVVDPDRPVVIDAGGKPDPEKPWINPEIPEKPPVEVRPEPPVQPAPWAKMLGTRAEYLLDASSAEESAYKATAVRYWDVYSDGTKILREGWSRWTGTIDVSLANTDLEGGNVVGLQYSGERPPISV